MSNNFYFVSITTDTEARSYVSDTITNITEEGTTLSFYVDIDKDSTTGWHDTNAGFKLEYTDYKGEKQTLECNENPQVYWVQNTYDYVVNYYKDSFNNQMHVGTADAAFSSKYGSNVKKYAIQPVMAEGKNAGGNSQMRYPTMVPPVAGQIYFQTID